MNTSTSSFFLHNSPISIKPNFTSTKIPINISNTSTNPFSSSSLYSLFNFSSKFYPKYRSMATTNENNNPITPSSHVLGVPTNSITLLFVEMGVGYDQHGQDVTSAAMRACRDAISSNSIPAFRRGSIPGVSFDQMKLQIKLGVPRPLQQSLDIDKVKSVFPYGKIENFEVVDGGLICSSGVLVEEMGDKNEDCYIVNAAVYVGY